MNLVESHGVRAQDEHLIPTPNEWTNQESEIGYPTIPNTTRKVWSSSLDYFTVEA
jgi:hypothetical protein